MNTKQSKLAFEKAQKYIPGGVNSPVRAFKSVGIDPLFIDHAKGSEIFDIDGNKYIDFVSSWGPMILGHARPEITEAIVKATEKGTSYGAPTELESQMAELIIEMVPSVELVRMVNSGTEATMSAIRLARAYTHRDYILKFEGNYHGHADSFLIKAGSGAMTLGEPNSPGVPKDIAEKTLIAKYNDQQSVKQVFEQMGDKIAAIIVEPVAANMGVVLPEDNFLEFLRQITSTHNSLLIFDEVITGFRISTGGAQKYYNVIPDITTLGKIIGGGLPVGAYGGKQEIMEQVSPKGSVYQAGTLSGNPLAMAAGYAGLKILNENPSIYEEMKTKAEKLAQGIRRNIVEIGIKASVNQVESLLTLFFGVENVNSFDDAAQSNTVQYAAYFRKALKSGIYLAPSQFEASFISAAHSDQQIEYTIATNFKALQAISK